MLNLRLPKKYLKYQRVWYSGFSNIGVLGEPNIYRNAKIVHRYKHHPWQKVGYDERRNEVRTSNYAKGDESRVVEERS